MTCFTESVVEDAALAGLAAFGYAVEHGREIAGEPAAERSDTKLTLSGTEVEF